MLAGWAAVTAALIYLTVLFAVAYFGDTRGRKLLEGRWRPSIYAFALAVYCTSWTFLGSVGLASRNGLDFLPIYLGPLIAFFFGLPLIAKTIDIAKAHRITSIADFIGSRYGKSQKVAAVVALIAILGTIPYIALQLKAISAALETIVVRETAQIPLVSGLSTLGDMSLFVTLVLAAFAVAFGTRNIEATEHQNGLMLAIALESFVKLVAFLVVGGFVVFYVFNGFDDLFTQASSEPRAQRVLQGKIDPMVWITTTILSGCAIFLLPRQFHVMVVENRDLRDLRQASWMFPAYLIAINIFVIPIALAGLIIFPDQNVDRDLMMLSLPLQAGAGGIALIAFIGALSAATAMVIVESVACGIMISNDLVVPFLLRRSVWRTKPSEGGAELNASPSSTMVDTVLTVRRIGVVLMLFLGFAYYRASEQAALATIGLLSFAAIAQIMPAFVLGLYWQRANARGALTGLICGFAIWFYLLFLPTLGGTDGYLAHVVRDGPFGLSFLAPSQLIDSGTSGLIQGTFLSLGVNIALLVGFSIFSSATPIDRVQASLFTSPDSSYSGPTFKLWRSAVLVDELRATVSRYLGNERTDRAFVAFFNQTGGQIGPRQEADAQTIRFAEQLLASAIGAASSRLVLSLMLKRRNVSTEAALKLLDDASAAIQHSRTLLQHGLDHARQGVTVFDRDLRLMCWNRSFQSIFSLPDDLVRFGVGLDEIVADNARRGLYGQSPDADVIARRITALVQDKEPQRLFLPSTKVVIEIRSNHLPDGGLVSTFTDITEAVAAEKALEEANATLEKRVKARTEELTQVNKELARAKLEADDANASKTRFLAAASHDIAQPLNAARLYSAALADATRATEHAALATNVESALGAVDEILSALLEISRLDAGRMKPDLQSFAMDDLLTQMRIEFAPVAAAKGIELTIVGSSQVVLSDRRMLRRILQNLISNAVKYTVKGKVLVGCRRVGNSVRIVVSDTGIGIPASKLKVVFKEFQRLDQGAKIERGLGLGLSIVERISKVLDVPVDLDSRVGRGSSFAITVPRGEVLAPKVIRGSEGNSAALSVPLSGLTVCVIDNEPAILDSMRKLLEGWGCVVLTAGDANGLLRQLKGKDAMPDIALVDFHLDAGTGLEAIRKLRRKLRPDFPAVLITADRSPELRDLALADNVEILNKPVKPSAMRALLMHERLKLAKASS